MNCYRNFDFKEAGKLIKLALKEDVGKGDVTSELLIPENSKSDAELLVKENGIIAGLEIFKLVFKIIDKNIKIVFSVKEGDEVKIGQVIGKLSGNTRNLLMGERLGLNLLQRMSGIATLTGQLTKKLNNKETKIIDTRKTTPNLRIFEKLAVKIGGGENHRAGLYDMVLIKDNHIEANGRILNTLEILKGKKNKANKKIEIEVKNIDELKKVLSKGKGIIDMVMLDNFSSRNIEKAVELNDGIFQIEVSGGINSGNIKNYSKLKGIDFISIGSLTHSVPSLDISLNFVT
ncbi:MAG: carboxylating nicotinate-nucleotide diphosphorylase [Bacteroidota bacterium]|nr:carboxylating nicotinate-nucleotide diphosphorylase [Bacteroidota bacterium]